MQVNPILITGGCGLITSFKEGFLPGQLCPGIHAYKSIHNERNIAAYCILLQQ